MNYWLLKTEPGAYSIDDLERDQTTYWDGVRNYQARNYLRDSMKIGDKVLFYHSNTTPMAIVGVATVSKEGYPDKTAWDPAGHHFDPASTPENPIWMMIDIAFDKKLPRPVTLDEAKADSELDGMVLTKKGSRLSVQPVTEQQFKRVLQLGGL